MKIGLLDTCIGNFGQKGFYNTQEIGLGKALLQHAEEVYVYKLLSQPAEYQEEIQEDENGHKLIVRMIPSRNLGSNGLLDVKELETSLDVLVYFSDTQLVVPRIWRWTVRNGVRLIPYLGVIESHSTGKIKKRVMDLLFGRNLAVYKKHHCAVKTPAVKEALERLGVPNVTVTPVGLDLNLMKSDYRNEDVAALKRKYGYAESDKVLLFVGRMTEEKHPLRMVDLFARAWAQDPAYKLLMVGSGELREAVAEEVKNRNLTAAVQMIDRIPNKDIWELYRIADCFVNLSQHEIFGMAILEAMYYGCKVAAWEAPGPSFIIEDGISGCLADSEDGILEAITEKSIVPEAAHERIINHFIWERTAEKILSLAER